MGNITTANQTSVYRLRSMHGFTLVELLVVIGIIALLISLLLPALGRARQSAQLIACSSNMRQLCIGLIAYQQENNNQFPPYLTSPAPGQYWCDADHIGRYVPGTEVNGARHLGLGVFVCPADEGAARSYAMNIWASSAVPTNVSKAKPSRGVPWEYFAQHPANIILITEKWSTIESPFGWLAQQTIGFGGKTPGPRFGAAGGIGPPFNAGRFGLVSTEIDFARHNNFDDYMNVPPDARVNIGFVDGHVEAMRASELADFETGLSILVARWSASDEALNN